MSEILQIGGILRTKNGVLVTTAGGAPCCCGPTGIRCECDPSLPIISNARITTCSGNGPPDVPVTLPPYRVETLRVNVFYTIESELRSENPSANPPFSLERRGTTIQGTEVLCRTARITQNLGRNYQAFEYAAFEPDQTGSYEWTELTSGPTPSGVSVDGQFALARTFAGDCLLVENFDRQLPPPFFDRDRRTTAQGITVAGGFYRYERVEEQFISGFGGTLRTFNRREVFEVNYTRTLDLCEGGGGGGSGSRPGNCAGCGDPARLTIV